MYTRKFIFLPRCQCVNLKLGEFRLNCRFNQKVYHFKITVWVNSRRGKTVCKYRRANKTQAKITLCIVFTKHNFLKIIYLFLKCKHTQIYTVHPYTNTVTRTHAHFFLYRINPLRNYEYLSTSNLPLNNHIIQSDLETCSTSDKKIISV